jgi:hypothetical protein
VEGSVVDDGLLVDDGVAVTSAAVTLQAATMNLISSKRAHMPLNIPTVISKRRFGI